MNKRSAVAVILLAIFLGLTGWASRPFQKAPDFTLPGLDGGAPYKLSEINRDKPVLLIFWASWCPSCVEEIPELNKIRRQYTSADLAVLAVNVQESREVLTEFRKKHRLDYPVLMDESGEVSVQYKIEGLPVSVLLAKGGEILYYGFSLPGNLSKLLETRRV